MKNRTSIILSRQSFNYNIEQIKKAAQTDIAVVVKANAYGHGIAQIAQMADENPQVSWLCTASVSEALTLRKAGIKKASSGSFLH